MAITKQRITTTVEFIAWIGTLNWVILAGSGNQVSEEWNIGVKQSLLNKINDDSFFLISEMGTKIDNLNPSVSSQTKKERIEKLKSFLINALESSRPEDIKAFLLSYNRGGVAAPAVHASGFIKILQNGSAPGTESERALKMFFESYANRNREKNWYDLFLPEWLERENAGSRYEDIEAETVSGSFASVEAASAGFGAGANDQVVEVSDKNNQCILMSMLFDPNSLSHEYYTPKGPAYTFVPNLYHDRILLFNTNTPELLNNKMFSGDGAKKLFEVKAETNDIVKKLYYVYEQKQIDSNGNTSIKTFETPLGISDIQKTDLASTNIAALENKILQLQNTSLPNAKQQIENLLNERELEIKKLNKSNAHSGIILDSIDIDYNGSNPSTARNDVKVTIKFKLESFSALNENIGTLTTSAPAPVNPNSFFAPGVPLPASSTVTKSIKLRDLVVAGVDSDGKAGAINALKNSYAPFTNRIRLKIKADPMNNNKNIPVGSPIVLDLTTIDHQISRNSADSTIDFTINYRGYFHSILTMPFADVIASEDVRTSRQTRHANINKLILDNPNCKPETLREILRVERDSFDQENSVDRFGEILNFIYNERKIFQAKVDYNAAKMSYEQAVKNLPKFATAKNYITNYFINAGQDLSKTDVQDSIDIATKDEENDSSFSIPFFSGSSADPNAIFWVFLGDIIYAASNNLYKTGTNNTIDELDSFNLKTVLAPISIPNPLTGVPIQINPAQIPVDIRFFAEWWNENVVKKDLKIYPYGTFIRDIIERLVNNILFETCLSHLLPDEQPPMIRCTYSTSKYDFFSNGQATASPEGITSVDLDFLPTAKTKTQTVVLKTPYFSEDFNINDPEKEIDAFNYLIIYQQSPPLLRELNAQKSNTLKDEDFVPTICSGLASKNFAQVENVSFSKTDAPFLREARYFNNNFGGLALMNNVYDLSFSLSSQSGNTFLFPGTLINFILTDFENQATSLTPIPSTMISPSTPVAIIKGIAGTVTPLNYQYTNNDPHHTRVDSAGNSNPTDAYLLGFGGYYIIKSVSYNLSSNESLWTIKVDCKFIGTDFDSPVKRDPVIQSIETDKQDCINVYNDAVAENEALVQLEDADATTNFTRAVAQTPSNSTAGVNNLTSNLPPTNTNNTSATPVSIGGGSNSQSVNTVSPTISTLIPSGWTKLYGVKSNGSAKKYYLKDGNNYYQVNFDAAGNPTSLGNGSATKPSGQVVIADANGNAI